MDTWSVCHCDDHRVCSHHPTGSSSPYCTGELLNTCSDVVYEHLPGYHFNYCNLLSAFPWVVCED